MENLRKVSSHWVLFMLLTFLFFCAGDELMAQAFKKDIKITDEQMDRLKSKTVVLPIPASQYKYLEDYKAMIPKAWTLTPIVVIKYSEVSSYADPEKYAFLAIGAETSSGGSSGTHTHYWLGLQVPYQKEGRKKTTTETDNLCWIWLYPDTKTQDIGAYKNHYDELYEESNLRNFTLPYMMAYLRNVQKNIKNQTIPGVYSEAKDDGLLAKLAKDTLYIPDSLVYHRSGFSSKEELNEKEVVAGYTGKYRIVSTAELTEMVKNKTDKKPLFLFEYVLSSTDKFVSVYNVTTGDVVYHNYVSMSYNLKPKDMEAILE